MTKFQLWRARTVNNWRWWVVLPAVPFAFVFACLQTVGEWVGHGFEVMFRWQRKGRKA